MSITVAPLPTSPPAGALASGLPNWQAPLVPLAVATTLGIALDRVAPVPLSWSVLAALTCVLGFGLYRTDARRFLPLLYLWTACAAAACAWHHTRHTAIQGDDVGRLTDEAGRPVRLRGWIETMPAAASTNRPGPLRTMPARASVHFLLRVITVQDSTSQRWRPASGVIRVTAPAGNTALTPGAGVELIGRLALPERPANPGEFAFRDYLVDHDIAATLTVREAGGVIVREPEHSGVWTRWPALVQSGGQRVLTTALPGPRGDLAAALLLGDSPRMTQDDWNLYQRSGVIHVLAISGQHLVILSTLLWFGLRLARVPRRGGALLVALLLLAYALVAGGRPPVMRSAWMVLALSGGILLRRPTHPANTFALAWLLVALWNPADVVNSGCQLSFLAVAVLIWGVPGISQLSHLCRFNLFGRRDPLQQVIDESRPPLLRYGLRWLRAVVEVYLLNALVWLVVTPLSAYHFHVVSPLALFLGPPLVGLTAVGLIAGFGVLLLAPLATPLAWPFTLLTHWSLAGCTGLTELGTAVPGAYFYVPDISLAWLVPFYVVLFVALAVRLPARQPRVALSLLAAGLAVGVVALLWPHNPGEFRCTFLAVGHGGCAVIETRGGKTLLYDIGSMAGPDLTRRQVAPFLWSRGICRIDELILSHADLDHFNGLIELLEYFPIGQVTHTPTFPQREVKAMPQILAALAIRGIPMRVVSAGSRWAYGDLTLEVLHPPADGPEGKENVRSLVLLLRQRGLALLLTGDLEDDGLRRVLALPPQPIDVLMAPHHGSARSSTPQLAHWASPQVVVICQGRSDNTSAAAQAYSATRSRVLGTWPHGAVTVRQDSQGAWVETFRSRQRWPLAVAAP